MSSTLEPTFAAIPIRDPSSVDVETHLDDVAASTVGPACANCQATIPPNGHFCAACGAPRLDERPITVRRFASEIWNEFTSIDSQTVRTFRALLASPGTLTREFLAGKTRWYLSPLRMYLLAFGLMVFARSFTSIDQNFQTQVRQGIAARTSGDGSDAEIRAKAAKAGVAAPDFATVATDAMQRTFTNQWLHLIDPLSVAAVLGLMYYRRRRNFAEHVVFALHMLAFNCVLSVVTTELHALRGFPKSFDAISVIHWLAFGTYFYFAARKVYGEGGVRTGAKSVVFVVGGQLSMFVVPVGAAFISTIWSAVMFGIQIAKHAH